MTKLPAIISAAIIFYGTVFTLPAQQEQGLDIVSGEASYSLRNHTTSFTNGGVLKWNGAVLQAESGSIDNESGETLVNGKVRIQMDDMLWTGEHARYNFKTHQLETDEFRTGKPPVFAAGRGLRGDITNSVYYATNAFITTDDIAEPVFKLRAKHIRVIPGKRIVARDATLWLGDVPVFYFPYFSRNLGDHANNFNFTPGYRSSFGAFLLNDYTWFLNDELDGRLHLDYRQKRGIGAGPDLNLHLGRWGEANFRYYYLPDDEPGTNRAGVQLPENRQRIHFSYQATPWTNLNVKALVRYQSDSDIVKTFYESEYRDNPQPDSFVELNKAWSNFTLDVLAQPRVNDFFETVARLPDVRLTGFRQQIGATPLYYESESTLGFYQRLFAETNSINPGTNYEAARADTYHQITLPKTLFGWLNVTPRVGGRFTYYSEANGAGARTEEASRGVFNTGAEVSFKASRVWPHIQSRILDLDGVRHIVQPSVNYVYVPRPSRAPATLPMFDYVMPSLRLLPVEYPAYNSIDSVDSQNVVRWGVNNKIQTRRGGQIDDLLAWELMADWRLHPGTNQGTYGDLYSDLIFKPRGWLKFESQTRFDINNGNWRMLLHTLTFEPNNVWSWTVGHFYLRDDLSGLPTALGPGNNLITSSMFYRLNENWGFRSTHHFDSLTGRMQEQYYTVYRDLRSWTVAVTGGVRDNGIGPKDFTVALSFSLKAVPHTRLGGDTVRPYSLLGR